MSQSLIEQGRTAATELTKALDLCAAFNTAYTEAGGQTAVEAVLGAEGYAGDLTTADFVNSVSTVQAFINLRGQGHGVNLAKVRR